MFCFWPAGHADIFILLGISGGAAYKGILISRGGLIITSCWPLQKSSISVANINIFFLILLFVVSIHASTFRNFPFELIILLF